MTTSDLEYLRGDDARRLPDLTVIRADDDPFESLVTPEESPVDIYCDLSDPVGVERALYELGTGCDALIHIDGVPGVPGVLPMGIPCSGTANPEIGWR
ncbi:hypothetical protein [Gordonia rhizosphera]|uniref:Uncharacterized protein n=1 Tax=Gordonia rhizosphera NBRC 16068 TaxID=1108045 RepID=K6WF36_9ACTN|nr:hypothetical protein [Gordonia rhizosphera]GAB92351.1 hypothetical protein GORHZ_171_00240 [Gordonia rhizosphera NBRC 16068]